MSSHHSQFGQLCRALRVAANLKQRQVAEAIGIAASTYANLESSPWKVIQRSRMERLAELYQLGPDNRARLVAAWEATPLSPFGERNRARWEKRRQQRSKLKHYDRMRLSLVECLVALVDGARGRSLCTCQFGGGTPDDPARSCVICEALENAGLVDGWTDPDNMLKELYKLQEQLESQIQSQQRKGDATDDTNASTGNER